MATASLPAAERRPVVLLVHADLLAAQVLETVLQPAGFVVVRSSSRVEGVGLARTRPPDAVIVDSRLPDGSVPSTCRALSALPQVGRRTPLFVSFRERVSRIERREALEAGAWHLLEPPLDSELLLLHLGVYVEARREAERYRDATLLDETTGLYSQKGVARRGEELWAWAARLDMPLACVVLAPAENGRNSTALADSIANALRVAGRRTDAIGMGEPNEFVIIAAATDDQGTRRMTERLVSAAGVDPATSVRAGYALVAPQKTRGSSVGALVGQARAAMHEAEADGERWLVGSLD